jgi:hypothetical protein
VYVVCSLVTGRRRRVVNTTRRTAITTRQVSKPRRHADRPSQRAADIAAACERVAAANGTVVRAAPRVAPSPPVVAHGGTLHLLSHSDTRLARKTSTAFVVFDDRDDRADDGPPTILRLPAPPERGRRSNPSPPSCTRSIALRADGRRVDAPSRLRGPARADDPVSATLRAAG